MNPTRLGREINSKKRIRDELEKFLHIDNSKVGNTALGDNLNKKLQNLN